LGLLVAGEECVRKGTANDIIDKQFIGNEKLELKSEYKKKLTKLIKGKHISKKEFEKRVNK